MGSGTLTLLNSSGERHPITQFGSESEMGRELLTKITFSSSYATGGDTFDFSNFFSSVFLVVAYPNASKFLVSFGSSSGVAASATKLKVIDSTSGSEVSNTTDLSAQSFYVRVYGL